MRWRSSDTLIDDVSVVQTLKPHFSEDIPSIFITNINDGPSSIANALYRILVSSSNYKKLNFISDSFIAGMRILGDLLIGIYSKEGMSHEEIAEKIEKIQLKKFKPEAMNISVVLTSFPTNIWGKLAKDFRVITEPTN